MSDDQHGCYCCGEEEGHFYEVCEKCFDGSVLEPYKKLLAFVKKNAALKLSDDKIPPYETVVLDSWKLLKEISELDNE